jgi:hypothetical protein
MYLIVRCLIVELFHVKQYQVVVDIDYAIIHIYDQLMI